MPKAWIKQCENGPKYSRLYALNTFFSCSIRFPSTSIRLYFQSLLDESEEFMDSVEMPDSPEKLSPASAMKPLMINIPHPEALSRLHGASPPSPTGTIR